LQVVSTAKLEPALLESKLNDKFQFLRLGYFCLDKNSSPEKYIFNRTVGLKDSWAKEAKKEG
jgi:glutaminyl-tRNA synthetase